MRRVQALALSTCLLCGVPGVATRLVHAQVGPAPSPTARLTLGSNGKSPTGVLARQNDYLDRLRAEAGDRTVVGSAQHNALVATGLGRATWSGGGGTRNLVASATGVQLSPLDPKDPAAQRWPSAMAKFKRMAEEARLGFRVIGGQPPPPGYFKETIGIVSETKICSGVVVAPYWVLTAAHCVCDLKLNESGSAFVYFGDSMASDVRQRPVDVLYKDTRMLDRNFCKGRQTFGDFYSRGNDLALIKFDVPQSTPIDFVNERWGEFSPDPRKVAPARIATSFRLHARSLDELVVVGFGINDNYELARAGWKIYAAVPIESRICGFPAQQQAYRCAAGLETVLVDPRRGRDTCRGDSGGPAFAIVDEGGKSVYYLVGITSRAVEPSGDCGPGGIYTLITPRIVSWMRMEGVPINGYDFPDQ